MSAPCRRFAGASVLVTGAAGAIGSATARRFAAEGARLVLADRDAAGAERTAELAKDGWDTETVVIDGDLASEEAAAAAVSTAVTHFGGLDVVAAIAGAAGDRVPIHRMEPASWDRLIATNLRSVFLTLRYGSAAMVDAGRAGSIVLMSSSMAAWDVLDGGAAYAAGKAAILALTRSAAFDLAPHRIRVNAVCPGVVESSLGVPSATPGVVTPTVSQFAARIPLRRVGQPDDVAAVIAFLASSEAAHVTGVGWLIDGGQTLQSWANAPVDGM
jgi:NAD(P)-dependent dehydrogenase (short-subunit alcohol dehydrogenase family)